MNQVARKFTLGKKERLKSRRSIEQLFNEGKKVSVSPYRVLYLYTQTTNNPGLFFGTGVSSKNFKRAVDRNKIKRLTREAFRLQKEQLKEKVMKQEIQLNIFFVFTGKEIAAFDDVYKKIGSALKKVDKLLNL